MSCDPERLLAYVEDELSPTQRAAVEMHCTECVSCGEELALLLGQEIEMLAFSDDQIPDPRESLREFHEQRLHKPEPRISWIEKVWRGWGVWWYRPVWIGAVMVLLVSGGLWQRSGGLKLPSLVPKGIDAQMLYSSQKKGGRGFEKPKRAKHGMTLYPSDAVQFIYQIPEALHMMLLGINEQGKIYVIEAKEGTKSVLTPRGKGSFPRREAFELDDYIGLERFFLIYHKKTFSADTIKQLLHRRWKRRRDLQTLTDLGKDWGVRTFLIRKRSRSK